MNHFENQEKILNGLRKKRDSNSSPRTIFNKYSMKPSEFNVASGSSQIFLDKIPSLTTSRILQHMSYDTKDLAEKFWQNANNHYNVEETLGRKIKQNIQGQKQKRGYFDNSDVFSYPTTNEEKAIISDQLKEIFNWNEKRERSFQEARSDVKTKHSKEINVSNWYELAFLPMVQEINLDFKKLKQRDIKMQKFAEGNYLIPEDIKFLVDTSDLLNSCIDRKFLQDSVDIIDEEVYKNLELYLSENILMNYEEIKSVIQESRIRYLKGKNHQFAEKNKKYEESKSRKFKIHQNQLQSRKTIKMFRTICDKLQKNTQEDKKIFLPAGTEGKKYLTENSKEVKKRNLHPPSKIMSSSYYERNDYEKDRSIFA